MINLETPTADFTLFHFDEKRSAIQEHEPTVELTEKMKWAYRFWEKIKGDKDIPSRTDFSPADILPIMRNIALINIVEEEGGKEPSMFFRLVGSNVEKSMGKNYTNYNLKDVVGMEKALTYFKGLIDSKQPELFLGKGIPWKVSWARPYKILGFPLSEDGDRINIIMLYVE